MISVPKDSMRSRPSLDGIELADGAWQFDPQRYRSFLRERTGIDPGGELTGADCYRIGNRLEAFIEDRRRRGEWEASLVETEPEVDTLDEIAELARLFRQCHARHVEGHEQPTV